MERITSVKIRKQFSKISPFFSDIHELLTVTVALETTLYVEVNSNSTETLIADKHDRFERYTFETEVVLHKRPTVLDKPSFVQYSNFPKSTERLRSVLCVSRRPVVTTV